LIEVGHDSATMHDFISGRLSDDECRAFEDRLVREPKLVRELEQSLRMREGLQQLRTQGYFEKAASRGRRIPIWVPALVAAAGAGLALFLWLPRVTGPSPILLASLESRAAADVTPLVTAHFTFVSVRGGSVPDLDLPSAGLIEIRAAPSTNQTIHRYRVSLVHLEGAPLRSPLPPWRALPWARTGTYIVMLTPPAWPGAVTSFGYSLTRTLQASRRYSRSTSAPTSMGPPPGNS